MLGDTSPVKAPFSSQCIFCAPIHNRILELLSCSKQIYEGHITTSALNVPIFGKNYQKIQVSFIIIHLPVSAINGLSRHYIHLRYLKADNPGNSLPSRNSNKAPPPVEMCVIFWQTELLGSCCRIPPPTIVIASDSP